MRGKFVLTPVRSIPDYAVIVRAIHERGRTQEEALAELDRRRLWLTREQREQAGLLDPSAGEGEV